jgi:putative ATPase
MEQTSLLEKETSKPLAERLRPRDLDEFVGQKQLLGEDKVLRHLIESDQISSMIFWGPPGVGKTTLAEIIAHRTKANFIHFSAVTSGINEIKAVMATAEENRKLGAAPFFSSMKSTGSTKPSKMPFCPTSSGGASF